MKKHLPLTRSLAALLTAFLLLATGNGWTQTTYTWTGSSGGAWLTSGNWSPPGPPATTGIAAFGGSNTATTVGINTNTQSSTTVAALTFLTGTSTSNLAIGNSTTSGSGGTLTLNGATLNSVNNVIIRSTSSYTFTLQDNIATGNKTLGVILGNGTDNVINTDGSGGITISSIISGSGKNLTKAGSGTGVLTLTNAANTYSGTTTITTGELRLNPTANATFASQVVLNGGTLSTTSITATRTFTSSSTLKLNASSTIALGSNAHSLKFANSSAVGWTGSTTLTITGWTGTVGAGTTGTAGKIFIGTDATGLTASQLAQIKFTISSVDYPAMIRSDGEIVPTLKYVITSLSPATPTAGVGFSVTVQSQDFNGTARNVVTTTSAFSLTTNGNAGTIGGTTTGSITNGTNSVTVTGVILSSAGTGATLTATRTSGDYLITGTSSPFDVSGGGGPILDITGTTDHGASCLSTSATPITYTITNSGTVQADNVSLAKTGTNTGDFNITTALSSTTIAASGGTATYTVTFTPSGAGARSATITASSTTSGSNSPASNLTGTGTATVAQAVTSSAANPVGNTTATLNGNLTTLGVCPPTQEKGFVYSSTITDPSAVNGATKTPVSGISTGAYTLPLTGLPSGTLYYFKAYAFDGTNYTYSSPVLTFTTTTPLTNDDCSGAITLTPSSTTSCAGATNGSVLDATESLPASCTVSASTVGDVWYKFVANSTSQIITVAPATGFDAVIDLRSGACNGTNIQCRDAAGAGNTETMTANGLTIGSTYYIRVYDYAVTVPSNPTFTICVTKAPFESFETGTKTGYAAADIALGSGSWNLSDALIGTAANDRKNGSQSARVQNSGIISMNFNVATGVQSVSVLHAKYGTDGNTSWRLEASTDNGSTWTAYVSSDISTTSTTLTSQAFTLNLNNNVRFRVVKRDGTTARLNIDDIDYTAMPVTTPVFSLGATSSRCQGAGSVIYTATANNTTGITYSLDATSLGAGNSINSSTGSVTYVSGWSGTSVITASAAGLNGPATANHTVTVEATPVAGTLAKTPDAASVCEGTSVSAALTAGSGGNGTDELEYQNDGGSWAAYTSGSNLSTTGHTTVSIRTRRTASVCAASDYTMVSWSVEATPVAGTLAKTPDAASVCEGTDVSAALTAGSGGNGTDELEYRYDGGSWATYSSTNALATTGHSSVDVRTRRTASVCLASDYTTVSWSVTTPTTPTFTQLGPYTQGDTPGTLPGTSNNSITGTWSPATISTAAVGTITYTFTPSAGCATAATMDVTVNAPPVTWSHLLTTGQPQATRMLGDHLNLTSGDYFINVEIGQADWNQSDAGIGKSNSDPSGWSWKTAGWYENGEGSNKKVRANFGDFQFTSTGTWYFNGRVKADVAHPFSYSNSGDWQGTTTFAPTEYFLVNALTDPSNQDVIAASASQIDLNWTPDATPHQVMVVRKLSTDSWTEPSQGTAYAVNDALGNGTVVYKGFGTSFSNTGLAAGTTYDYKFYSENYNYYSTGVTAQATTYSSPTILSFTPTSVCAGGSVEVTIMGTHFTGATEVKFNAVDAASFKVDDDGTIRAFTPDGVTTGKIAITTPGGTATSTVDFTVNPLPPAPTVGTITQPTCTTNTGSVELSGLPAGNWTINPGGITGSGTSTTLTDLAVDATYTFTVTPDGGCTSEASANVVINAVPGAPTAYAGPDAGAGVDMAYQLNGSATNAASVKWTIISGSGTFSNDAIVNPTFTASATGNMTLRLTAYGFPGCGDATDNVLLVVFPTEPVTWVGTTSNNWNTNTNWLPQDIPGATTDVFIPSDAPHFPTVTLAGAKCKNLTLEAGASLIDNGNLTVSGTVTVKHAPITPTQWHYISSPVAGAVSGMFTGHFLRSFAEATNVYTPILPTTVPLNAMQGYALWVKTPFSGDYVGTGLNPATNSTTVTKAKDGWNLVGNPYTSAIDWGAASGWTKINVNDAIYLYNGSAWGTYVNGAGTNFGSRYIAPGQGFFVEASGSGTLGMTSAVQVHNSVSFYKNANAPVSNMVRIEVSGNGYKDDAVVRFTPEATAEFDGNWDAHKRYGDVAAAAELYTLGSIPLAINSLPAQSSVPVGIKVGANGSYTIAATEMNDLSMVTLEDMETGIFTDLSVNPYTFDAVAGTFDQRFKLHFSFLSVNEAQKAGAVVYSYRQTLHVNMKDLEKGDIFVYNIAGQLVASKRSAQGTNEIKLPNTGNYIVKVITRNNTVVRKVFIQ